MVLKKAAHEVLAYGLSDIGLVRKRNEDAWAEMPNLHFYVLADGMGGHRSGDIAAREVVQAMCYLMNKKLRSSGDGKKRMRDAIVQANRIVYKLGMSDPSLRGMGTTLCCLQIEENHIVYGHVGDSRIYLFRDEKLYRLTNDHSLMRELLDVGDLTEKDEGDFLYKHIITKAIGTEPNVDPSVDRCEVERDDLFMICSDGLTDVLNDQEIEQIITFDVDDVQVTTRALVAAAIDRGGIDNVTVVLLKVVGKRQ